MGSTEGNTEGNTDGSRSKGQLKRWRVHLTKWQAWAALEGEPQMRVNRDKQNIKKKSYVLSSRYIIDT